MSQPHLPSYVHEVLSFLRKIGAFVTRRRICGSGRIVITWRLGIQHHDTKLARHVADPAAYAARKIAAILAEAGLQGVAA